MPGDRERPDRERALKIVRRITSGISPYSISDVIVERIADDFLAFVIEYLDRTLDDPRELIAALRSQIGEK